MNMHPYLTNTRISPVDTFYALQTLARREQIWARLTGQNTSLATFPEQAQHKRACKKFAGMKDIPIEQIVGTMESQSDFDHEFRPLKSSLRKKWLNAYHSLANRGWAPVLVHQFGDRYYVEDGHHRVSVARSLGRVSIQAKIWEYPVHSAQPKNSPSPQWMEKNSIAAQCQE